MSHVHSSGGASMDMDMMGGVERMPDGTYHYTHGGWSGHMLPGIFFVVSCRPSNLLSTHACSAASRVAAKSTCWLYYLYYAVGIILRYICLPFLQLWGGWWALALFHSHLRSVAKQAPFESRAWYLLFFGTQRAKRFPVEPLIKVLFTFIGKWRMKWA